MSEALHSASAMHADVWTPAYVALGSNLEDPQAQVQRAFEQLRVLDATLLVARSRLYRSSPMGPQDQPEFVNAVAGLLTRLDAPQLLAQLQRIELNMGRTPPTHRWGPRVIDLDLLMHGSARCESPELHLPHPGIGERNFVLQPLRDIAPDLLVAGVGRVRELAARVGDHGLAVIE